MGALMTIRLRSAILEELHALLQSGNIAIDGADQEDLVAAVEAEPEICRLEHPEVRYEVTDRCNARCIMCPRDKHEHGREHGIMDLARYKKSIDEILDLGA